MLPRAGRAEDVGLSTARLERVRHAARQHVDEGSLSHVGGSDSLSDTSASFIDLFTSPVPPPDFLIAGMENHE